MLDDGHVDEHWSWNLLLLSRLFYIARSQLIQIQDGKRQTEIRYELSSRELKGWFFQEKCLYPTGRTSN